MQQSLIESPTTESFDSNLAIQVENVSKIYPLYNRPIDRLKEALHPFRKKYHHDFYALKDVSFEVKKGETVGIIGQNGSGKSTLLKIITGVLTPTSGKVTVNGRISSLLELGTGFNPELTGIENVYFYGTINGFTKEEMDAKLDDILSFADIGEFVYQPVKTYSSGMFARLAFAAAINIDPDILIVDEVLSVGDMFFQQRCFFKFQEFREKGVTILYVSHNLDTIVRYCSTGLYLNEGILVLIDKPKMIIDQYKKDISTRINHCYNHNTTDVIKPLKSKSLIHNIIKNRRITINPNYDEYGTLDAQIIDFGIINRYNEFTNTIVHGDKFSIYMKIRFNKEILNPIFAFAVYDLGGMELFGGNSDLMDCSPGIIKKSEEIEVIFNLIMFLRGGVYSLNLGVTKPNIDGLVVFHRLYNIILIEVIQKRNYFTGLFSSEYSIQIIHN